MHNKFIHNLSLKLDVIGFGASLLCAIHCAALPLLISILPLIGFEFFAEHEFEYIMVGISIIIGSITFVHGYFMHHRNFLPIVFFIAGLSLILGGHYMFPGILEYILAPIGAGIIGYSHLLNRRLTTSKNAI